MLRFSMDTQKNQSRLGLRLFDLLLSDLVLTLILESVDADLARSFPPSRGGDADLDNDLPLLRGGDLDTERIPLVTRGGGDRSRTR